MVNIEAEIPKVLEFVRLSKTSAVRYDKSTYKTYVCRECQAVVVSKIDHAQWHQKQLEMIINISHRVIPLEDARRIIYRPQEVNPVRYGV